MPRHLAAVLIALAFGLASPNGTALAQSADEEHPSDLAREGVENLMRAFEAFINMIPQYEAPELDENGNIIIRRKKNQDVDPPGKRKADPEPDNTRT